MALRTGRLTFVRSAVALRAMIDPRSRGTINTCAVAAEAFRRQVPEDCRGWTVGGSKKKCSASRRAGAAALARHMRGTGQRSRTAPKCAIARRRKLGRAWLRGFRNRNARDHRVIIPKLRCGLARCNQWN